MMRAMAIRIGVLLVASAAVLAACGGTGPANGDIEAAAEPTGPHAPDFTITTFAGEEFSLSEQRGTPVVLNFWESW